MSFVRTISGYIDKSAKEKATMANERRRQSLKWLGRNGKKKPLLKEPPQK